MAQYAGSKLAAEDFSFPDVAEAFGNGNNTVTATTWTDLPTTTAICSITNSHSTADMLCLVQWGAWMYSSTGYVACCPRVSGSTTIAAGTGGVALGWGAIPMAQTGDDSDGRPGGFGYVLLPASATAATFTLQAFRSTGSGTQTVNYPTIIVVPLRYVPA